MVKAIMEHTILDRDVANIVDEYLICPLPEYGPNFHREIARIAPPQLDSPSPSPSALLVEMGTDDIQEIDDGDVGLEMVIMSSRSSASNGNDLHSSMLRANTI